jgi:eukaryotic-like serine/threonine-protein kinase
MLLLVGSRLGTYEILSPLGAGGMGEVYRARDLRLGREVAIKVLPESVASSPDRLARFEREARTVAGLNHPNIVTLFSVENEDGVRFLTMELVEGQSLSNLITPGGLPLARVLELSIPLADALVAAHERAVIHRDLKPGNVMVTREGRVKVLDFGLAKTAGAETPAGAATFAATAEPPISGEGQVLGTVPYMAPEQLRGEAVDARSDLFALGIILYELATGRRPFAGATWADITSSILRDTPEPLTGVRADLPGDLERIVERCLEKNPRARAQSALEICNDLRRVKHSVDHGERGTSPNPASQDVASIAVLPFVNRSRDEEDEYFSDGLADELLSMLAKIRGLRVAARTSAFQFKGKTEDLAVIGKKLHVATLLDGSVRKAGNRVRISVQLVKVSDGYHLWSETYDRTLDDIFAVQDDIAQSVVKELRSTLLGEEPDSGASGQVRAEVARAAKGRGLNAEAYRLYLQGRHLLDRRSKDSVGKAIGHFQKALELDPGFALVWVGLAMAHRVSAGSGWVLTKDGFARAREAAERALALAPDLAEAHSMLGSIYTVYDWDWLRADAMFRRALELEPHNPEVLRGAGELARSVGRVEEAIGHFRRALEQDPLSPGIYQSLALALFDAGHNAEAEEAYRMVLELASERISTHADLALALLVQGRGEEALKEAQREPQPSFRRWALAIIHHAAGRAAESDEHLHQMVDHDAEHSAYQIAEVHAVRGEADRAFRWLEQAYEQRDSGITEAIASPQLRPLHGDPRWGAFLNKMGLRAWLLGG